MTKQEFLERCKGTGVSFSSYYKYTFTFTGTTEQGEQVVAGFGGNADDIYRANINKDSKFVIEDDFEEIFYFVTLTDGTGKTLFSWYDY